MKLTNKDLKKAFRQFNKAYFDDELSDDIVVKFDTENELESNEDGAYEDSHILIRDILRYVPDFCFIVLLHEMAHAKAPEAGAHGYYYGGVIDMLYKKGAYDPYL